VIKSTLGKGDAISFGRRMTAILPEEERIKTRGSIIATTDIHIFEPASDKPKRDELLMGTIAHELTHQLIDKRDGAFDDEEHTSNSNGVGGAGDAEDETCLMYRFSLRPNRELETVRFFPVVPGPTHLELLTE
jgi:hypothetical protein